MSRTPLWLRRHWRKTLGFLLIAGAIWWLAPARPAVTLVHSDSKLEFAGFSPDGRTVATRTVHKVSGGVLPTVSGDVPADDRWIVGGPIRLWDAATGSPRTSF